jgi:hypothetical protein
MDPWLENPSVWRGLHALLIGQSLEQLQPQLKPRGYYADIEERVWLEEGPAYPDVTIIRRPAKAQTPSGAVLVADEPIMVQRFEEEVREGYVQIREQAGHRLVTSIEILSPVNKSRSRGRRLFRKKQRELQKAGINLVEVDLLRQGRNAMAVPSNLLETVKPWDYLICLWRPNRADFEVYPIELRARLPRVRIPLKATDPDATLDLQAVLDRAYDIGPYPEKLEYARPPLVPLREPDVEWADELLRKSGHR